MVNLMRTDTGYGLNRTAGSPDAYGYAGFGAGSRGVGGGVAANSNGAAGSQKAAFNGGGQRVGDAQGHAAYASAAGAAGTAAAGAATGAGAPTRTGSAQAGAASGTQAAQATSCETCRSRKYQDISTDAGVSFKAPANIDPSVAASAVMSHEREHVALAEGRANDEGGRVISSITLETAICEECGRVYVSGGKAHITTITPVEQKSEQAAAFEQMLPGTKKTESDVATLPGAKKAEADMPALPGAKKAEADMPALPGAKKAEADMSALPGAKKAEVAMQSLPGSINAGSAPIRLDTHGTDQFRKQYMRTMAGNFGLFFDSRT